MLGQGVRVRARLWRGLREKEVVSVDRKDRGEVPRPRAPEAG